jgi:hypothetical protein
MTTGLSEKTFRREIEDYVGGADLIESVVVGNFASSYDASEEGGDKYDSKSYRYDYPGRPSFPTELKGKPLSWDAIAPHLEYLHNSNHGIEDCHPVYVYTSNNVYFVACYDGKTWLTRIPRHPIKCKPFMVGGG